MVYTFLELLSECLIPLEFLTFVWTMVGLYKCRLLFRNNEYRIEKDKISLKNSDNKEFTKIVININDYLKKNNGTADFNILQNKVDRTANLLYKQATSTIAFPTYIGLIGTFLGVIIGLDKLGGDNFTGIANEESINSLIGGVQIAMKSSLWGLILTTISYAVASYSLSDMNRRKSEFYDFIQNDLLPNLGTSIVDSLSSLKQTIGSFKDAFDSVIGGFKTTFTDVTNAFGSEFRSNVLVINEAVQSMGDNMAKINEGTELQKELLLKVGNSSFNIGLNKMVLASEKFSEVISVMHEVTQMQTELKASTSNLVSVQKGYNESLQIPLEVTSRVSSILDRIVSFEQNINLLGEGLAQSQLIGNKQMNEIEAQLNVMEQKRDLALRYHDQGIDLLEGLYKDQENEIKANKLAYMRLIHESMNDLSEIYSEGIDGVKKGKDVFLTKIHQAIDLTIEENDFGNLHFLPKINEVLLLLKAEMKQIRGEVLDIKSASKESLKISSLQKTDQILSLLQTETKQIKDEVSDIKSSSKESLKISSLQKTDEILALLQTELRQIREGISNIKTQNKDALIAAENVRSSNAYIPTSNRSNLISKPIVSNAMPKSPIYDSDFNTDKSNIKEAKNIFSRIFEFIKK